MFTFLYPIGYQSAQFFRRALHYASGGRKFLHQSTQPPMGGEYILSSTDRLFRSIRTLQCGYIYHHHVVPLARISPTLSRHFSLSFIASGRSSGLHPVSSHSCCMYVRAGRPALAWPYAGVHRNTSLMSSSLLLQQCPECLARLTCIVFVMGGKWPYSWCLVGCCRQDLFNIALNILV